MGGSQCRCPNWPARDDGRSSICSTRLIGRSWNAFLCACSALVWAAYQNEGSDIARNRELHLFRPPAGADLGTVVDVGANYGDWFMKSTFFRIQMSVTTKISEAVNNREPIFRALTEELKIQREYYSRTARTKLYRDALSGGRPTLFRVGRSTVTVVSIPYPLGSRPWFRHRTLPVISA